LKSALNCYRAIPDLNAALELLPQISDGHPAGDALIWMSKLQKLVGERPDKFLKNTTSAEKKMLEKMLEQALGATRRKPAAKKAPAEKVTTKAATRPRAKPENPDEYF